MKKTTFFVRVIAAVLILSAVGAASYATFKSSNKADTVSIFANRTMLDGLWNSYKLAYWESETGRTLDRQQHNITTSEGQSYTMLRAVWESDKPTFDKSWAWTQQQLQREDKLFSWRWGQRAGGDYGVLTDQNGQNTASDADSDIALSLLMAASRWQQSSYLDDAKKIIPSIWSQEVIMVKDAPYLVANNLEKDASQDAVINPSYLAPYAFRLFDRVDTGHDWMAVVDSSYDLINNSIDNKLDKGKSAGLVPDWVAMNRQTGEVHAPIQGEGALTTNYSYDAMRTAWRLALDDRWNNEPRARQTLEKLGFLAQQWQHKGSLYATYSHDGNQLTQDEPPEAYGTSIGYFAVVRPDLAKEVYDKKLISLFDQNTNKWRQPMNYYSDNWTWFGIALYIDRLDNLAKDI